MLLANLMDRIAMNPADATGWMVARITTNATLMETIRIETTPAFKSDGTIDTYYLVNSIPIFDMTFKIPPSQECL